MTVFMLVFDVE